MKTLITTAVLLISLAFAHAIEAQAQDPGEHGHQPDSPSGEREMGNKGSMQQHMREMQQTMQRIQDTDDPEERRELMQQHRQQMHEAMGSMCGMMGDKDMMRDKGMMSDKGMKGDKSMMSDKGKHERMHDMDPEARRKMMQDHMQMMESMMEQMRMHMEADKTMQQGQ